MKKQYVTRIDESAQKLEKMIVSGGRLGVQIELKPEDLKKARQGRVCRYYFQTAGISTDNQQGFHSHRIPLPAGCRVKQHLR